MNSYLVLLILHLLAAFMFIGTVFFEVLILEGIRQHISPRLMNGIERALGNRIVKIIPFTLLTLYGAGIGMVALRYTEILHTPFASTFGTMLLLKIILASSVFCHFLTAMFLRKTGRLKGNASKWIHWSVFSHMIGIIILAKSMFYWN
ncbi:MAG: hypothetical protein Q4E16_04445 [Neisseria sp.]|nr:hypothetical protein [Neisseria sp.]